MIFHWDRLKKSMNLLLDALPSNVPQKDIEIVREFIDHYEFGVGFEHLCAQLYEDRITISSEIYRQIDAIGKLMKMDEKEYIFLKDLVKND